MEKQSGKIAADRELFSVPNLRKQPSFNELSRALNNLALSPENWSEESNQEESRTQDPSDINRFLMSIVASDLRWFDGPSLNTSQAATQKDIIYDLASKRMAERCGRSAMPEMTRTWVVPASEKLPQLHFEIREPPLTGDNLGLKTWGTAFAVSKILEKLGNDYFCHVINPPRNNYTTATGSTFTTRNSNQVLELGAGTGLVGIALAAIWHVDVILTDLPEIHANLLHNIDLNSDLINKMGGVATGKVLDWKNDDQINRDFGGERFEVVVAADPFYDDDHPSLVAAMIQKFLKHGRTSLALVAVPLRDKKTKSLYSQFVGSMREKDLQLKYQGSVAFRDDWGSADQESIICWWSIWAWYNPLDMK
ncbi:putative methyltransferase-domain-containing protein [Bisporella sp. PMI_857]|nr:putative methyltransferase-domain-containing protein [Bisporella sp. PMI_857]